MTAEFTFGAYFRLCRPLQLSSDLSLHRNTFWKFQGSGHLSTEYFRMVLARRDFKWSFRPRESKSSPSSISWWLLFPFLGLISGHCMCLHIAEHAIRKKSWYWITLRKVRVKCSIYHSHHALPGLGWCNLAWHHQFWWWFFTLSCLTIRLCFQGEECANQYG